MAYVYRHIRLDENVPFYIGIGNDCSFKRAHSKTHRNKHWHSIVGKSDYKVEILVEDIEYQYAKEKEKEFISLYKRKEDGGTLCNITLGGDGVLGLVHTSEAKEKMGKPNRGKVISEWHKQRISESHKGKIVSSETKSKMSESVLGEKNHRYGKKVSDETKLKMINSAHSGEANSSSKLKESDIIEIRNLSKNGLSSRKIADIFSVKKGTILSVINKKTWKHIL